MVKLRSGQKGGHCWRLRFQCNCLTVNVCIVIDITMTSWWARWCLKSPGAWLFTKSTIQAQIKENIKATRHWPLCREFTGDRWIPRTVSIWWRHHEISLKFVPVGSSLAEIKAWRQRGQAIGEPKILWPHIASLSHNELNTNYAWVVSL